ncbi:MAG: T9SS type A sorting domain-containing protein [Bacteroidota bacterium]
MKKITTKLYKISYSVKVLVFLCTAFPAMEGISQNFRVETFESPINFNAVNPTNILGENIYDIGVGGDLFTGVFLSEEIISPNTGQWFVSYNDGNLGYEQRTQAGNSDGGFLGRKHTRSGAIGVYYVFNNASALVGGNADYSFDYKWDHPNSDFSNGMTAAVIGITPDVFDIFYYTIVNSGTGTSSDNFSGRPRQAGSANFVTPGFTVLNDQNIPEVADWTTYSASDLTFSGAGQWIIVSYSAVFNSTLEEEGKDVFGIDNATLPFVEGAVDDVQPSLKRLEDIDGENRMAMFSSEGGTYYLVPGGTEVNVSAITSASVDSRIAYPLVGNYVELDGLADGKYEIYIVDYAGNISLGRQINIGADTYAPLITSNPSGTSIFAGFDDITAVMDEPGSFKLVEDGAGPTAAAVVEVAAEEKLLATLIVPESVMAGQYDLYAIDAAGNASTSIDITVEIPDVAAPMITFTGPTEITTEDNIDYQLDEEAVKIYVVPDGTSSDLETVTEAALDSVVVATMSGSIAAVNLPEGLYVLYALDRFGNFGTSGGVVEVADLAGPIAFEITTGDITKGFPISITLNENGNVYVVPIGTNPDDVVTSSVVTDTAFANTQAIIPTSGDSFIEGQSYDIYAADARPNLSALLSTITIAEEEIGIITSADEQIKNDVIIFPNPATDVIYTEGKGIKRLALFGLNGDVLMDSDLSFLDVRSIRGGTYILRIYTETKTYSKTIVLSR